MVSDDRGQLLLIGAVVLAIAVVGLVVVLNTVLYTQNVTNREALDATADAAALEASVVAEIPGLVGRANRNATYASAGAVRDAINETVARYGALVGTSVTRRRPASIGTRVAGRESVGLVVGHDDDGRPFTDRDGDAEWTVADPATVQRYRMRVDAGSLATSDEEAFRVRVASGGDEWTMRIHADGSDVALDRVAPDGSVTTCTMSPADGAVDVDFVNGTAAEGCEFEFGAGVSEPYELGYANATNATGRYRLVLDGTDASLGAVETAAPWASPYRSYAVDALAVNVTYATPELRYRTTTNLTIENP
ncbi:DUF7261 family protein [Halorussus marinus]|uniref:DUF7261 family protein n=1 Tax=Halorussus marinus TaxID=2505976 RepID=UPI00106E340D|nr:hypothetical protein [Halorussus marinus]